MRLPAGLQLAVGGVVGGLAGCPQPADDWAPPPPTRELSAPDAAPRPVDAGGRSRLGGPCSTAADCTTGRLQAVCETGEGFAGGYCFGLDCRPGSDDCGPLGACVIRDEGSRCWARCRVDEPGACRVGYACGPVFASVGQPEAICAPSDFF